ncbi:MAG: nitroreductase family protein [Bacillota bacterium]
MDILSLIKARRSVRRFQTIPFPEELLTRMLEAGQAAPTAGNVQPWQFFVVRNREKQAQLADAALGQTWILSAPVIIVVCADLARSRSSYGRRGSELYAIQDSAAAIQNILLTATALGIASCWVGAFREELAAQLIGVDGQNMRPVALIPLGYAAEPTAAPPKRALGEIVEYID